MVYIGLARYTEIDVKEIISMKPTGVILGDILCDKRMFPFSGQELNEYINQFVQNGIKVIFQTPMYLTDRIFEKVMSTIDYYASKNLIDGVIVQDVGAVNRIKRACPNLEVIWGRMGYARTPIINVSTISFYIECGITGFECKTVRQTNIATEMGVVPYLVYGWPAYSTINRECYYKFENNIFDDACCCGCLGKNKIMLTSYKDNAVTIDGYVLGFHAEYIEENRKYNTLKSKLIIYGENIEEIKLRINELEEQD